MGETVPVPSSRKRKLRRLRSFYGYVPFGVEAVDEAPFVCKSGHVGDRSARDLRAAAPRTRYPTEESGHDPRWGEETPSFGEEE